MPGCCSKPYGSPCGRPYSCRSLLSDTQTVTYSVGLIPGTAALVVSTAGVYLSAPLTGGGELFTLTCDSVVTLTFVTNVYGLAVGTVSVALQVLNSGTAAVQASELVPPIVQLGIGSIDAVTASFTLKLSAGTYKALVLLTSLGGAPVSINIAGALTVTSVKRYA